MTEKIIQQGAEASIILVKQKGKEPFIVKDRIKKSYRLDILDERIRKQRTRSEAKLIEKASKVVPVPELNEVDERTKKIKMEFLTGKRLSTYLDSLPLSKQKKVCKQIGGNVAKLHDIEIIHGDLTTSNMILVEDKDCNKNNKEMVNDKLHDVSKLKPGFGVGGRDKSIDSKVYFIDFGLGFISPKVEDKAVDLHVLRQALEAKHFKHWQDLFAQVLSGYSISKEHQKVLEQFKKVETRGRYKEQY